MNVQGMIGLAYQHFTATSVIIDSSQNHQWMLESWVKGCWADTHCLSVFPVDYL